MRRFVNSIYGKVTCHLAIAGLLMPLVSVFVANQAYAQVNQRSRWAVVEFLDESGKAGENVGALAAEAVNSSLVNLGRYDIEPQETVARKATELGLVQPILDKISLMRLAQDLRVETLVTGQVKNWEITASGSGKKASVILRVVVYDVASGLPINGAALQSSSPVRPADAPNDALLRDAISAAASVAVSQINTQILPQATVLNTQSSDGRFGDRGAALINQGARSGFKRDQQVIVIRGREQVATARVTNVDPESAEIQLVDSSKGVQPGDKVRVVFSVPDINSKLSRDDSVSAPRRSKGDSSVISVLLILGVVALALGGGRGSNSDLANDVRAEAIMDPAGQPGVKVSWARDLFVRGNTTAFAWQIYRNDQLGTPVAVVPGNMSSATDGVDPRDVEWSDFGGTVGGRECLFEDPQLTTTDDVPGVVAGRGYTYSVALVYRIAALDLPGGGTGGSGGTTGGLTTGGGTTGGTTGGGTTTGATECYFISTRVAAKGIVTPLAKVGLVSPAPNAVVSEPIPFTFTSAVNASFPTTMSYALQVSTSPVFTKSNTRTLAKFNRNDLGDLSTPIVDLTGVFAGTTELWWRVGARAVSDNPGPAQDATGERYVFSEPQRFTRPGAPPPPPLKHRGGTKSGDTQNGGKTGKGG